LELLAVQSLAAMTSISTNAPFGVDDLFQYFMPHIFVAKIRNIFNDACCFAFLCYLCTCIFNVTGV
jgi:TRAP-type C4-dicarboxylate transport system permease small subunit